MGKARKVDPSKVRRGFKHSEETKAKIAATLRERWANDEKYRLNMMNKTNAQNIDAGVRKRIGDTLRKKWEDPEFHERMMAKMAQRKSSPTRNAAHRAKISESMKKRWQDTD